MGNVGRKRKELAAREPSGKLQRPSRAQLEAIERRKRDGEKAVVLAQPHRMGETSDLAGSAFGRFCLRIKAKRALYDAGQDYAGLVRRWRAAKGVPMDVRLGVGGSGDGPSDATVKGWERTMVSLDVAMLGCTREGYYAMRSLVLDDQEVVGGLDDAVKTALFTMAVHSGFVRAGDHPFGG